MRIKKLVKGLFLKTLILVFAGLLISESEKSDLSVAKYKIKSKKVNSKYRFVFLSDLHNKEFGYLNKKLIKTIDELKPDAILIGGDMMTSIKKFDFSKVIHLCKSLSKKYKIFYANGNHEQKIRKMDINKYNAFKNILESFGISYLASDKKDFSDDICISGLDISLDCYKKFKYKKLEVEEIIESLGEIDKDKFNILMAHTPNFFEEYSEYGADLSLCGHFHGGTIRIGDDIGLMTPQLQLFNDRVVGMKSLNKNKMIVSAGLGTHSINIRFNNKPQVVVVDIESDNN